MKREKKILIWQTKALGDCLMAFPSLVLLRNALRNFQIDFCCDPKYHSLFEDFFKEQNINLLVLEKNGFFYLWNYLRNNKYSAFLQLCNDPKTLFISMLCRIPLRLAYYNKHFVKNSFFVSKTTIQKRWEAEKNEALYNIDLAKILISNFSSLEDTDKISPITLAINASAKEKAQKEISNVGLKENEFIILHPVGNESWSPNAEQYKLIIELVNSLTNKIIILSKGPITNDRKAIRDQKAVNEILKIKKINVLQQMDPIIFSELIRLSSLVIAPSTGILHLAHYLGIPTLGLYPVDLRSEKESRWAPFGGSGKLAIIDNRYFPNNIEQMETVIREPLVSSIEFLVNNIS